MEKERLAEHLERIKTGRIDVADVGAFDRLVDQQAVAALVIRVFQRGFELAGRRSVEDRVEEVQS